MTRVMVFLVEGFEETEAITTIDILRRGGVEVTTVSLSREEMVMGSRKIQIKADTLFDHITDINSYDMLVLPGGPGAYNYKNHQGLMYLLTSYNTQGKHIAAICAAPTVLAALGLLEGKAAVCFPSCENEMGKAKMVKDPVVTDGNITTSKCAGTAMDFAFRLVAVLQGEMVAKKVQESFFGHI